MWRVPENENLYLEGDLIQSAGGIKGKAFCEK